MSLQPLEDRIVVKPGDAEETTVSGLVIPDTAKEKPQQGEVLAVGPGRRSEQTGELIPVDVAVGDVVLYSKYGGTEVTVDGDDLLVLSSRDVLAKVAAGQEEVALTNRDPGARGGRQRIPRPATARAGAAAPWARSRPGPVRSPSTGCATASPTTSRRRSRRSSPAGAPPRCSLPLFEEDGEARLVLTRRPETMPSHRGEIAFPGGKVEPAVDRDARDAALREAEEEIGLRRELVDVIAALPTLGTVVGQFSITPFVGLTDGRPIITADSREVDRVFDVAARRSCSPTACTTRSAGRGARRRPSGRCSSTSSRTRRSGAPPRGSSPAFLAQVLGVDVTGDWGDWTRA